MFHKRHKALSDAILGETDIHLGIKVFTMTFIMHSGQGHKICFDWEGRSSKAELSEWRMVEKQHCKFKWGWNKTECGTLMKGPHIATEKLLRSRRTKFQAFLTLPTWPWESQCISSTMFLLGPALNMLLIVTNFTQEWILHFFKEWYRGKTIDLGFPGRCF